MQFAVSTRLSAVALLSAHAQSGFCARAVSPPGVGKRLFARTATVNTAACPNSKLIHFPARESQRFHVVGSSAAATLRRSVNATSHYVRALARTGRVSRYTHACVRAPCARGIPPNTLSVHIPSTIERLGVLRRSMHRTLANVSDVLHEESTVGS